MSSHAKAGSGATASIKVNAANLSALESRLQTPHYDRNALQCGIVHMSVGAFHRSHECVYLDDTMAQAPGDWLICGVGLLDGDKTNMEALAAQNGLYTVVERTAQEDHARIIGSMKEVLHAPSNPGAAIKRLQDPAIKILSLTVTEKGYYYDQKQQLDVNHPAIQYDVQNFAAPKTAIGHAVQALKQRRENGLGGLTIMSCDNLPGNGHVTHRILTSFANLVEPDLAKWIDDNITFPNAMVDRITPATSQATIDALREKFGIEDAWPVACEDFRQWVLEDKFCQGRPEFEAAGVQIVKDVEPYEKMKVRLLNGSHSALSYLSYLAGYRDVDAAMNDQTISTFVRRYMDRDITPSVPAVPGIDLENYKDTLIRRFANPAIRDQILRLAEDGSQKIKNAIVPCLEYQLKHGGSIKYAALALAGWFRFLTGVDEKLAPIPIKDPMADILQARAKLDPKDPIHLLGIQDIFGPIVSTSPEVRQEVAKALESLQINGAKRTLEKYVA